MSSEGDRTGWSRRPIPARKARLEAKLAPIGLAIGGMLFLALAIAAVVTIAGLHFLHFREFRPQPQLSAGTLYDLLKVAFAFAAGIGGIVALVTAYRRQRVAEFAELRANREQELAGRAEQREVTRLFNERFATAAGQLGHDNPAIRLAGIYAMAGLADDWPQQRQTCIDVLCAYLRMPYQPEPAADAPAPERQVFRAVREVRHTVIRVITAHLQADDRRAATTQDWRGLDFDFAGAVLDGGEFTGAQFTDGAVSFRGVQFSSGTISFSGAQFSGGTASFRHARFSGGEVDFSDSEFTEGTVSFSGAQIVSGDIYFNGARFISGTISFGDSRFAGGTVNFGGAQFAGGKIYFSDSQFTGSTVYFGAEFIGADVSFRNAEFTGGEVDFGAEFTGGTVSFRHAQFTSGTVSFRHALFNGGTVTFADADWSVPPLLPTWTDPPAGVVLPSTEEPRRGGD
jgi:uncharacterized protein YjbI with pentapeptide repeats